MKRRLEAKTKEEILAQFIEEKKASGLSPISIKGYSYELGLLINKVDNISDFTQSYFTSLVNQMLESVKPATVNHCIRTYRAFLYWCMENEYIQPFRIKVVKYQEEPIRVYSQEDILKLTEKPDRKDSFYTWRNWAFISFALGTGARASTIVNIKLSDLDLNRQEVIYRHTKNKKSATIPLCDNLVKTLKAYINEFEITDYLFTNFDNEQMTTRSLHKAAEAFCKERNVCFKSVHAFRATFAREFIINGGNPFQLQKILDHSSLAMSEHYAQIFGADLHNPINDFSPLSKINYKEKVKRK